MAPTTSSLHCARLASPGRTLAGVLLLATIAGALAGCGQAGSQSPQSTAGDRQMPVRVAEVRATEPMRELKLPGIVRAVDRAEPAFLHPGHLAERFVSRGQQVRAGDRLASLQNPALGPALAAAEARVRELDERLVQLEADYARARDVHAQGLVSAEVLDRALAQRNATREARTQALAGVAEARNQLADAILRAPFDATVADLLLEPGDFVHAGQPVLVLAGTRGLEVEVQLPEGQGRLVSPGDSVEVRAVTSGAVLTGTIRELGLARESRPASAVITLPDNADWERGLSVQVSIRHAAPPALTVPLSAIIDPGTGQTRVFRVEAGRAVLIPVRAGRLIGAEVEVSGELQAGDLVVVAGHQQLLDGEAVRVLP